MRIQTKIGVIIVPYPIVFSTIAILSAMKVIKL